MKQSIITALLATNFALAYCPDCDIAASTTFTFAPPVIDGDNQTIQLTATVNCPRDTWHHSFAGYTIDWDDDSANPERFLYDLELYNYQQCISNKGVACGKCRQL